MGLKAIGVSLELPFCFSVLFPSPSCILDLDAASSPSQLCTSRVHFFWLPRWLSGKESACECRTHRRCRFNPGVRKIPWRRAWQLTPVFLTGKSHGQRTLVHRVAKELDVTGQAHTYKFLWYLGGKLSPLFLRNNFDGITSFSIINILEV